MSAVHAPGVQTQCRLVSSRSQRCSTFRPFVSIVPRGIATPIAPLLHIKLISVAPPALGGATSCEVQECASVRNLANAPQLHRERFLLLRCRRPGGGAGDQTHPRDRAG